MVRCNGQCTDITVLRAVLPQSLARLRSIHGLSQRDLARKTGIAKSTIAALETGQVRNVTVETIERLCVCFHVTFDYLLVPNDGKRDRAPRFMVKHMDSFPAHGRRTCGICDSVLRRGEPHSDPQCMMRMDAAGCSREYLASFWGFGRVALDAILADEYRREKKRFHSGGNGAG